CDNINSQYCNFCNQIRLNGNEVIDKWLINKGGFSKIYKAICINGIKKEWNSRKQIFIFDKSCDVILKSIKNSETIGFNFLNELENYLKCMKGHYPNPNYKISNYLGITQDPETKQFMLVVEILQDIAYGIEKIHNKQIVHQDLHSGNLLVYSNTQRNYVKVAYFGISKPLNSEKLMESCWDANPAKRPTATKIVKVLRSVLKKILAKELIIPEIIKMPSVGYKNSKSIYTSRPLSFVISEALQKYQTKSIVIDFNLP
ncbi:23633_t:CDS:2, partial [Gigaspora rosea]